MQLISDTDLVYRLRLAQLSISSAIRPGPTRSDPSRTAPARAPAMLIKDRCARASPNHNLEIISFEPEQDFQICWLTI